MERKKARHGGMIAFRGGDSVIYFRFPGKNSKDAFSLQQYHASALIVDEAGFWSHVAERAVISSVNRQRCVCMKYFGVVIDENPQLPIYYYTRWPDKYDKFRGSIYNMSSMINVYDYNLQKHRESLQAMGGSVTADGFSRQILGLLGEPLVSEFSPQEIENVCVIHRAVGQAEAEYRYVCLGRRITEGGGSLGDRINMMLRGAPGLAMRGDDSRNCMVGLDYGKSAPTQIWVMVWNPETEAWRLCLRLEMLGLEEHEQAEVCHVVVQRFGPHYFAMDMTGTHNPLPIILTNDNDSRFSTFNYSEIIWPVRFNTNVPVNYYEEKPENPSIITRVENIEGVRYWVEYQNCLKWAMMRSHQWFQQRKVELPQEDDRIKSEFTKLLAKGGKWEGVDHNIAAFLSFVVCHWQNYDLRKPAPREERKPGVYIPIAFDISSVFRRVGARPALVY